jgi:hypothetical protein
MSKKRTELTIEEALAEVEKPKEQPQEEQIIYHVSK